MSSVDELALATLPIGTPEFAAGPLPYFDAARRTHPWLARSDAGYVVTEYASSLPFAVPLRLLCQARDSCGERTRAHADTAKMSAATLAIRI